MGALHRIGLISLIGLTGLIGPLSSFAQTAPVVAPPALIVTWQADAYAPAGYPGKILPPRDGTVHLFVQAIDSNNKLISLKNAEIAWSANSKFISGGVGAVTADFVLNQFTTKTYAVQVLIKDYENVGDLKKSVLITRAVPIAVVEVPYADGALSASNASLVATPYFFNALALNDFLFDWKVQGSVITNTLAGLTLDLRLAKPGDHITAEVTVTNRLNNLEAATTKAIVSIKK